jgi:hypothetical protein
MSFFVEGINPSEKTPIKATLLYNDNPVAATYVNVKVIEGKLTLNVDNDIKSDLNDNDHKLKDQHDGFVCWEKDDWTTLVGTNDSDGLENLFAANVKIPRDLYDADWKFYIQLSSNTLTVYENKNINENNDKKDSFYGDRLAHLKDAAIASTQIGADWFWVSSSKDDIVLPDDKKDTAEYLFQVNEEGAFVVKILVEPPDSDTMFLLDTCKVTAKDLDQMFMYGSVRGDPSNSRLHSYPLDGNATISLPVYPYFESDENFASRDVNRDKYFIFIHGYNVDEGDAVDWNRAMFRRMYWTGFRGNYIGLTWHGDEGQIDIVDITPKFWANNLNAMQSSDSVMRFFRNTLQGSWNANSQNITVMAHSLGNLVMWDALRLYAKNYPNDKAVKNAVSVEAAVWSEAFNNEGSVEYTAVTDPGHAITYTIDQLKTHSWAFWFKQAQHSAKSAVSTSINSYLNIDDALAIMKYSDWQTKDGGTFTNNKNHYNRAVVTAISPTNRTPEKLANSIPALLQSGKRKLNYEIGDLNNPVGMEYHGFFYRNFNAKSMKWGSDEDDCHSDMVTKKYYDLYPWFYAIWIRIQ